MRVYVGKPAPAPRLRLRRILVSPFSCIYWKMTPHLSGKLRKLSLISRHPCREEPARSRRRRPLALRAAVSAAGSQVRLWRLPALAGSFARHLAGACRAVRVPHCVHDARILREHALSPPRPSLLGGGKKTRHAMSCGVPPNSRGRALYRSGHFFPYHFAHEIRRCFMGRFRSNAKPCRGNVVQNDYAPLMLHKKAAFPIAGNARRIFEDLFGKGVGFFIGHSWHGFPFIFPSVTRDNRYSGTSSRETR